MTRDDPFQGGESAGDASRSASTPADIARLRPALAGPAALTDPAALAGQQTQPSHWRVPVVAAVIMLAGLAGFGLWSVAGQQVGTQVDPMILETESLLDQLGFPPGPIDGIADADTGAAIRAYQQAADLPVDGRATPALLDDLRAITAAMPSRQ